jgi:hypothetical protein
MNNMQLTNSTLTGDISFSQPQPSNHDRILPSQIWQEGRKRNETHRLVIVLEVNKERVVIRNILSEVITKVFRERFIRGKTGYFYVANLPDINGMFIKYSKNLHDILQRTNLALGT